MADIDVHALAGAYALDAVDDLERASFERHLGQCPSCADEVTELREAAVRLADPTWSVPPPRLRTAVMERIARTRQVGPAVPRPDNDVARVVSRWRRWTAGAAAAGILAIGAAAGTWAVQEQRVREQRAVAAAARAENARIEAILSAPDVQMRSVPLTTGGRLTMAMSPSHDAGVLMIAAAAPLPGDRAFQLWWGDGAAMASAGVLPAGSAGATRVLTGVRAHDAVGVTVERAGGASQPNIPTATVLSLS
jgi:anti-sigma-K factor RskA